MVLRGKAAFAVVVLALAIAAASVAYAAIPDAAGVIHGCYKNAGGQLRVVNGSGDCIPSETAIQWSQSGPPGGPGPKGDKGDPGDFSGTFESPNHQFKLVVADSGIELSGPSGFVKLGTTDVEVKASQDLELAVGAGATITVGGAASITTGGKTAIDAGGNAEITAGGSTKIATSNDVQITTGGNATVSVGKDAAFTAGGKATVSVAKDADVTVGKKATVLAGDDVVVHGTHIQLNGCHDIARVGDPVLGSADAGGAVTAQITGGSTTVCAG